MSLDIEKICRTCLGLTGPLLSIYDGDTNSCLAEMLKNFTRIKPTTNDNMPSKVCLTCISEINHCYSFKMKCENANRTLRQLLVLPEEIDDLLAKPQPKEQSFKSTQTESEAKILQKSVEVQTIELEKSKHLEIKLETGSLKRKRNIQIEETNKSNNMDDRQLNDCSFATYESSSSISERPSPKRHIHKATNNELSDDCNDYDFTSADQNEYVVELENNSTESPVVLENMIVMPAKNRTVINGNSSTYKLKQENDDGEVELEEFILGDDEAETQEVVYIKTVLNNEVEQQSNEQILEENISYNAKRDRNEYQCLVCTRKFISNKVLQRHSLKFHGVDLNKDEVSKSIETKKYTCTDCNIDFTTKRGLGIHHAKNVCNKLSFQCELCERVFETADQLVSHKTDQHIGHQVQCIECSEFFENQEKLSQHLVTKHKRKLRHQCNICKKVFTMTSTLRDHLRLHTGEKPFNCKICDKSFTQKSNLKQHMQRHEQKKTHKCEVCSESFVTRAELVSHERRHTGVQPFKCEYCPSAFSSTSSLAKHRRKHTGERPYSCDICSARFTALNVLKNHRRLHTGEKPYQCEFCNKRFTQSGDCSIHMRTHVLYTDMIPKSHDCVCGKQYPIPSRLVVHQKKCRYYKRAVDEGNEDEVTNENEKSELEVLEQSIESNLDKICEDNA